MVSFFRAKGLLVNRVEVDKAEVEEIREKIDRLERTVVVRSQLLPPMEIELKQVHEAAQIAQKELAEVQASLSSSSLSGFSSSSSPDAAYEAQCEDELSALEAELKSIEGQIREMPRITRQTASEAREAHASAISALEEELEKTESEISATRREITQLRRV